MTTGSWLLQRWEMVLTYLVIGLVLIGGFAAVQPEIMPTTEQRLVKRILLALEKRHPNAYALSREYLTYPSSGPFGIALAAGASGVHVGAEDLSVQEAQSMVGLEKLVGRTTHSAIEATDAQRHRAAYIGVGPCYPSETKPFSQFATAELLSQVANNLSIPVFAIGGMKIDNL